MNGPSSKNDIAPKYLSDIGIHIPYFVITFFYTSDNYYVRLLLLLFDKNEKYKIDTLNRDHACTVLYESE